MFLAWLQETVNANMLALCACVLPRGPSFHSWGNPRPSVCVFMYTVVSVCVYIRLSVLPCSFVLFFRVCHKVPSTIITCTLILVVCLLIENNIGTLVLPLPNYQLFTFFDLFGGRI